jgi:hypothetical protein
MQWIQETSRCRECPCSCWTESGQAFSMQNGKIICGDASRTQSQFCPAAQIRLAKFQQRCADAGRRKQSSQWLPISVPPGVIGATGSCRRVTWRATGAWRRAWRAGCSRRWGSTPGLDCTYHTRSVGGERCLDRRPSWNGRSGNSSSR